MEIIDTATQWAKDEVFSSRFFILFAIIFLIATIGFWQLGKTELAKAFVYPTLIAGILLMAVGVGIFFTNKSRVTSFAEDFNKDSTAFVQSEIERTDQTLSEFKTIVFKVIPLIVTAASLLLIFVDRPIWRAIGITTIAMMVIILFVDSNANARIETYHKQLLEEQNK